MSDILEVFRAKFRVAELLVEDFGAWTWSVRPIQVTLGAGVLALKRPAAAFSDVRPEEMAELAGVVTRIEQVLRGAFVFDRINYLMLMMVDYHVHFHVIPRYAASREFAGVFWTDRSWPGVPDLGGEAAPAAVLQAVRDHLRSGR